MIEFSLETIQTRKQWNNIFKELKNTHKTSLNEV